MAVIDGDRVKVRAIATVAPRWRGRIGNVVRVVGDDWYLVRLDGWEISGDYNVMFSGDEIEKIGTGNE